MKNTNVTNQHHPNEMCSFSFKEANIFNTGGPAEHVHRLNPDRLIAGFPEKGGVPGLGCHVAGDVNHPGRSGFRDGANHGWFQSFPGRIHQHRVTPQPFPDHPGQKLFGGTGVKRSIPDLIIFRVPPGVFHCLRDDFYTDGTGAAGSRGQRDGSGTAVNVTNSFFLRKPGEVQRCGIQLFRLDGIDLEKGGGEISNRRPHSVSGKVSLPYII